MADGRDLMFCEAPGCMEFGRNYRKLPTDPLKTWCPKHAVAHGHALDEKVADPVDRSDMLDALPRTSSRPEDGCMRRKINHSFARTAGTPVPPTPHQVAERPELHAIRPPLKPQDSRLTSPPSQPAPQETPDPGVSPAVRSEDSQNRKETSMGRKAGMDFQITKGEVRKTFKYMNEAADYLNVGIATLRQKFKTTKTYDGWEMAYVPRAAGESPATKPARKPRRARKTAVVTFAPPAAKPTTPVSAEKRDGIYRKFQVTRTDGSCAPGGKHHGCVHFVLDLNHDKHAIPAIKAYAESCRAEFPQLAADLDAFIRWQEVAKA